MITFRGSAARVLLPPTSSVEAAAARLAELPTGGRTPLAAGFAARARGPAGLSGSAIRTAGPCSSWLPTAAPRPAPVARTR